MKPCVHRKFKADVAVEEDSENEIYSAKVRLKCAQCGATMMWMGIDGDDDGSGLPSINEDRTEARLYFFPKD